MTNDVIMFLALNALLHGRSCDDAFDGHMSDILKIKKADAEELTASLDALPEVGITDDPLVMTLLNYYCNGAYTNLKVSEDYSIPLRYYAEQQFLGKMGPELLMPFLKRLIMDYAMTTTEGEPHIIDGVLYCTQNEFQGIEKAMMAAYKLFTAGPSGTTKKLNTLLRKHTSLEDYSPMLPTTMLDILERIVKAGMKPTVYQNTFLGTPDLVTTYEETGCVMAFADSAHEAVNWLVDLKGAEGLSVRITVPVAELRSRVFSSVRDLDGVMAAPGRIYGSYTLVYPED